LGTLKGFPGVFGSRRFFVKNERRRSFTFSRRVVILRPLRGWAGLKRRVGAL